MSEVLQATTQFGRAPQAADLAVVTNLDGWPNARGDVEWTPTLVKTVYNTVLASTLPRRGSRRHEPIT